jgi:hypothetical protein
MARPGHDWQCEWPEGLCTHPDHFSDMTPHALELFLSANGHQRDIVWGGFRFWNALSERFPEAKTYDEAVDQIGRAL